jgi:hypothetical protein
MRGSRDSASLSLQQSVSFAKGICSSQIGQSMLKLKFIGTALDEVSPKPSERSGQASQC